MRTLVYTCMSPTGLHLGEPAGSYLHESVHVCVCYVQMGLYVCVLGMYRYVLLCGRVGVREVRLRIILLSKYRCIPCGLYLDACRVHLYPAFVRGGGECGLVCLPIYVRVYMHVFRGRRLPAQLISPLLSSRK